MNEQCNAMQRSPGSKRLTQCSNRATHCEEVEPGVRFPVCDGPHVFLPERVLR
jgi:hypothetical protein